MITSRTIGATIAIITLVICIFLPMADLFGIKIPKSIAIVSFIFIIGVILFYFGAGMAGDFNLSLWKGILLFIYFVVGFLGGTIIIGNFLGLGGAIIFIALNAILFLYLELRNSE